MDACFVPFDEVNPYQTLLAGELEKLGVHVRTDVRRDDLSTRHRVPEVIHLHWLRALSLRPSVLLRGLRSLRNLRDLAASGKRIIWTAHNLIPHDSKHPWLQRWHSRQTGKVCSAVIAHSPSAKKELLGQLGTFLQGKVKVIPHGHYLDRYPNTVSRREARERLRLPPDVPVFLFLGFIRPYKGLQTLVRDWAVLHPPISWLVIAGRTVNPAASRILAEITTGVDRLRVAEGQVPESDVQYYMNAADAVVFPYRRVFTSGALVLAMSFGRACIAPRIGSIADYVSDSGAFLYDANKEEGLLHSMESALANTGRLAEMGSINRDRAARWDWGSIGRATYCLYAGEPFKESPDWWG